MDASIEKEISRDQINNAFKWNLSDLFISIEDCKKHKKEIADQIEKLKRFKGTMARSEKKLYRALNFYMHIEKEFLRLYAYANMLSDQDTRESLPLSLKQEMAQMASDLGSAASFIEPEILSIHQKTFNQFFKKLPSLSIYRQYLDDIRRRKTHTLSDQEERVIAEAGRMSDTAHEIFNILSNADLPYPTITLSDGKDVLLNPTNFTLYRKSPVRQDRKLVFNSFFGTLNKFRRTFGTQLYGVLKKNIFYKNVRKYTSCLESALDRDKIPTEVYFKLIENVNNYVSTLLRYLELKKKLLNIEELHYYDIYPSLVKRVDLEYSFKEAEDTIKKSLRILGTDYITALDKAFSQNWIDVYPNSGKRSGAYMDGIAYDVHPYILMNFKGKYDDVSTLIHELGHAMHSYFSNKTQPFVNAHYPIFLAEVASTVNEALLIDYELKRTSTREDKISLLGNYLDGFRSTFFRQTQFAEYELKMHELTEKGEALTGDRFSEIYLDILKKYYGHNEGVTVIDDLYGIEWAYIPHFYYNFYVFQYSTAFAASQAIVQKLLQGEAGMVDKYIKFLSSGRSDYAIPTLKEVGIDMTSDEPFKLTMLRMNEIMDELENLYKT